MKKETLIELIGLALESKPETVLSQEHPFEIGKAYLIRTVTFYYTGRIKAITGKFITLEEACWIPDTGRWQEATEKGSFNEVEPFANNPFINMDSVIDAQEITYKLPTSQK